MLPSFLPASYEITYAHFTGGLIKSDSAAAFFFFFSFEAKSIFFWTLRPAPSSSPLLFQRFLCSFFFIIYWLLLFSALASVDAVSDQCRSYVGCFSRTPLRLCARSVNKKRECGLETLHVIRLPLCGKEKVYFGIGRRSNK
jgi:hypothetical protein